MPGGEDSLQGWGPVLQDAGMNESKAFNSDVFSTAKIYGSGTKRQKRVAPRTSTSSDPTAGFVLPVLAILDPAGVGILVWEGETFPSGTIVKVPSRLWIKLEVKMGQSRKLN